MWTVWISEPAMHCIYSPGYSFRGRIVTKYIMPVPGGEGPGGRLHRRRERGPMGGDRPGPRRAGRNARGPERAVSQGRGIVAAPVKPAGIATKIGPPTGTNSTETGTKRH